MPTVSLQQVSGYDPSAVREGIRLLLAPFGGMQGFVRPGEKVLLKPNMLAAKEPDKAVTTHPAVVAEVLRLVRDAGGIPLVGDSPGIGSVRRVAASSGILQVVEEAGAELVAFDDPVEVDGKGLYRSFRLARSYVEADRVINLPKLKTHEMMTLTCAVKNLFGAVVGTEKAAWHLRAGSEREVFARMLLEISLLRPPDLTIVDGILAMEGNGPGSGDPKPAGIMMAGTDPVAIDLIAGELACIPKKLLFVEAEGAKLGLPGADRRNIDVVGCSVGELTAPFVLPHIGDVQFGLPKILKEHLRHHLTSRPEALPECRLCGICRDACPPRAIEMKDDGLRFDYRACIRCFCCRELCPHGALKVRDGFLLALIKKLGY